MAIESLDTLHRIHDICHHNVGAGAVGEQTLLSPVHRISIRAYRPAREDGVVGLHEPRSKRSVPRR